MVLPSYSGLHGDVPLSPFPHFCLVLRPIASRLPPVEMVPCVAFGDVISKSYLSCGIHQSWLFWWDLHLFLKTLLLCLPWTHISFYRGQPPHPQLFKIPLILAYMRRTLKILKDFHKATHPHIQLILRCLVTDRSLKPSAP